MIERLYIDNFRCLVNCEVPLTRVTLLLGPNGSGKSTVFDAADRLKRFVGGSGTVSELFSASELVAWQKRPEQKFEIDIRSPQGVYRYALKLEHSEDRRRCRVAQETLALDGNKLFAGDKGEMQLYNDGFHPGPRFSFDWNRSGLSMVNPRGDNRKLMEFKQRLQAVLFVRPCPPIMLSDAPEEAEVLDSRAANFASWYRFMARQDLARQMDLFRELGAAIDGFDSLKLDGPADATATLRVVFKCDGDPPVALKFAELSDGQRQLVVLHALLYGVTGEYRTLFLDEPDNYVALREIQPWLTATIDAAGRTIEQAIVISHHPEVIDQLAPEKGIWFSRDCGGPTRIEVGRAQDTAPLRASEVEARGW